MKKKGSNTAGDLGKGKQNKENSTGKLVLKGKETKVRTWSHSNKNKKISLIGTKPCAASTSSASAHSNTAETDTSMSSMVTSRNNSTAPILSTGTSVVPTNIAQQDKQDHQTVASTNTEVRCDRSSDSEISCSFSSDEDTVQQEKRCDKKEISSERHAKIDSRIVAQKATYWKGKDGLRGVSDPREGALIPIYAPKMERMNIAKMKALKARAKLNQAPPMEGDIVTPILADIDNANEINYSVVSVGAGFCTQNEVVRKIDQSDPNSTRPKAPAMKMRREDKVLPFPKRRIAAVRQEQAAKEATKRKGKSTHIEETPRKQRALSDSDTDNPVSDASWPTDQDESIATFRVARKKKPGKPINRPKKALARQITKKPKNNKRQKQPKKPQKKDIDGMISTLQAPLPRHTLAMNSALGQKETDQEAYC